MLCLLLTAGGRRRHIVDWYVGGSDLSCCFDNRRGTLLDRVGAKIAVGGEQTAVVDFNFSVFFVFWHRVIRLFPRRRLNRERVPQGRLTIVRRFSAGYKVSPHTEGRLNLPGELVVPTALAHFTGV